MASELFVARLIPFNQRNSARALPFAYAATVAVFVWICAQFYVPGKGFTYLVMFGGNVSERYIPALKAINYYQEPDSTGYDAQYYAQIAMRPWLSNRALGAAVDSLPYRARRILFCWTAYGLAGGDPAWALHIYAVQNIVCWFLLAAVLLYWFPPTLWENFFRWFGVMFSFGLCFSVRGSLVDGPSLLLIAVGMILAERGRSWWAAGVLGLAGLGKETNIIAGATFAPANARDRRGWLRAIAQGLMVVAPLAVWMVILKLWLGNGGDAGALPVLRGPGNPRHIGALARPPQGLRPVGKIAGHAFDEDGGFDAVAVPRVRPQFVQQVGGPGPRRPEVVVRVEDPAVRVQDGFRRCLRLRWLVHEVGLP